MMNFIYHTLITYQKKKSIKLNYILKTDKYTEKWGIVDLRPTTSFSSDRAFEAGRRTYSDGTNQI